ncbi:MAG: hypothetical protein RLZZ535_2445, partial [Cyanobacteriota bacterium]
GDNPVLGIVGRYIQNTQLQRTQIYDKQTDSLRRDKQAIQSSPSSIFVLILNNHRLIYLKETPCAPSLNSFQATIKKFIKLFLFTLLLIYAALTPQTTQEMASRVREWTDFGFSFAIGILGFLITGFTIFATVSKPSMFVKMAKVKHPNCELSYLKYNFFTMMNVFIIYLGFTFVCVVIKFLAPPSGFISILLSYLFSNFYSEYLEIFKRILSGAGIVIVGTWIFYLLVILQSFIFNIYSMIMTAIRWEIEFGNRE